MHKMIVNVIDSTTELSAMPSPTLTEAVTFTAHRSDGIIEGLLEEL
jgi:hypothetical protein